MNFLKRAMLAVTRRKGKTLILFVIFAAIANLVLAGLAIQHATSYASVLARQKLGGQLTLRFDTQRAIQRARAEGGQEQGQRQRLRVQSEPITEEMAQIIAGHKNIVDYNYIVNATGMAEGFEPVVTDGEEQQDEPVSNNQGQRAGGFGGGNILIPDVSVIGIVSTELLDAFSNGEAILTQGSHISVDNDVENVAIVEKNLAEQNGLKLGDSIKIKAVSAEETNNIGEFSIVGIYESNSDSLADGGRMRNFPFMQPYNRIYVDYKSAVSLGDSSTVTGIASQGISTAVFYVDDPKNIDKILAEARSMNIDWEKFTLDANDYAYQQMMGPIENVASFSKTVVYIVAIAGAVILALILMLSIKERMYETGVLLSMGEGKLKIIAQYVTEVLVIAVIAFSISAFSGSFIAHGLGSSLLDRELKVVQEQGVSVAGGGFSQRQGGQFNRLLERRLGIGGSNVEMIDTLEIQITMSEVGLMALAGLLIIVAGTILPAASVMRYNPKTILTKAT